MQSSPRIEELRQKFHENPRRYFAPLANEYRKAGDPEQAIAICRAHLAQQPGHMSGHVVYGQSLYDAGRMDEAALVFQQALALDPENIIVLRHLGDIARQRGDVEESRSWYSRALDGDPHDAEVAAYLAELTEPLTTAPQTQPEPPQEATSREIETAEREIQHEAGAQALAQAQPESAEAEAEALAGAESEGLAAESAQAPAVTEAEPEPVPQPAPEPEPQPGLEPEPQPGLEPEPEPESQPDRATEPEPVQQRQPVAASEPESEFGEWPEPDDEPEPALGAADPNETGVRDDSLVSPYAREMDFAAPSEMKWELNESPYLELVESSASDDAWDSVRSEAAETQETGVARSADEADVLPISNEARAAEQTPRASASDSDTARTPPKAPAEAPARRTPSRAATPVTESAPIVTRTLAELYLQQGYIEPALEIYRQLADKDPGDAGLQARVEELSSQGASAPLAEEETGAAGAAASVEAVEDSGTSEMVPAAHTGANADVIKDRESTAATDPSDELWDSADSWGDWPFTEVSDREDIFGLSEEIAESRQEAPEERAASMTEPEVMTEPEAKAEPQAEPTRESAAEPGASYSKGRVTVREFFATLGAARPPSDGESETSETREPVGRVTEPERAEEPVAQGAYPIADDAFASLFAGVPADSEDSRAAAVLSGAVAHGAPFSTPLTSPVAPPPRDAQANRQSADPVQESEEDIRRFREWLDGLAES